MKNERLKMLAKLDRDPSRKREQRKVFGSLMVLENQNLITGLIKTAKFEN
jgi:hypothetical protein